MTTYYHGSDKLFDRFDLSHALEGTSRAKYGYGIYVTSSYRSAAHYAGSNPTAQQYYVYTIEVPEKTEDNCIGYKQPVHPSIVRRAEAKLGITIPEKATLLGKDFRVFLSKQLTGTDDLAGKMAASKFLTDIGVEFMEWPFLWKYPERGSNLAAFDDTKVKMVRIDEVELKNKQLVEGSQRLVKAF